MIIDNAAYAPSEAFIKQLHAVLKSGTTDSRQDWFAVGDYKKLPNEVGGMDNRDCKRNYIASVNMKKSSSK